MKREIILYHSSGCMHCINMQGEWKKLKSILDNNHIAEHKEYLAEEMTPEQMENIIGFPTIKIIKDGNAYEYQGDRTAKAMLEELEKPIQTGGDNDLYFKIKYNKYKAKYYKVKSNLFENLC